MPTFTQLVKQGRKQATYKSNSPAMQKGLNTLKNKANNLKQLNHCPTRVEKSTLFIDSLTFDVGK